MGVPSWRFGPRRAAAGAAAERRPKAEGVVFARRAADRVVSLASRSGAGGSACAESRAKSAPLSGGSVGGDAGVVVVGLGGSQLLVRRSSAALFSRRSSLSGVPQASSAAAPSPHAPSPVALAIRDPPPVPSSHLSAAVEAVGALSRRATAGAVAARSGLSLPDAERALHELARRAQADVMVTSSGDVVYAFRPGFSSLLRVQGVRARVAALAGPLRSLSLRAARVAFGLALVASVAVVALGIAAVAAEGAARGGGGGGGDDDRDDRRRGRGGRGSYGGGYGYGSAYGYGYGASHSHSFLGSPFLRFDLSDLIYLWDPFYQKRAALYRDAFSASSSGFEPSRVWSSRGRQGRGRGRGGPDGSFDDGSADGSETPRGFLEAATSVVWGDGDPNADLPTRRWARVAEAIAARDGVVAAEELAPLLDGDDAEGAVLETLVRFGGEAVVTDGGELLYDFPRLREAATLQGAREEGENGGGMDGRSPWKPRTGMPTGLPGFSFFSPPSSSSSYGTPSSPVPSSYGTASARSKAPLAPLVEEQRRLTRATPSQAFAVAALGGLNAAGVLVLASMARGRSGRLALARHGLGWLPSLLPYLKAYALSYAVVPLLRLLVDRRANAGIRARNEARLRAFGKLAHPDARLRAKLAGAAKLAARARAAGAGQDYQSVDDVIWGADAGQGRSKGKGVDAGKDAGKGARAHSDAARREARGETSSRGQGAGQSGAKARDRARQTSTASSSTPAEEDDPLGAMRDFDKRLRDAQRERERKDGGGKRRVGRTAAQEGAGGAKARGPAWLFWGRGGEDGANER